MDTLVGFLLDNTRFLLGLSIGFLLGVVLTIAVMRLFSFNERMLRIAEANTLETPHYGPPNELPNRAPQKNTVINKDGCVLHQTTGVAQPFHDSDRRYQIVNKKDC